MKKKGGRIFFDLWLKKKTRKQGSVEFQVFSFTNKIRRLASHLELHKKRFFIEKRSTKTFGKTSTFAGLFGKGK
ncbi:hypothetical protein PVAP13_9KG311445 [Panicum virgatum]|uniref:Ribosomal protein S15 n=1 Tax=Panicum virgatum TaxID=38727 RepID=A0A8T0N921_PANVG|nr:hypothetical protein PVAP13_9KG311445 [Panicum virgatum]